jgi:hypothetical protein
VQTAHLTERIEYFLSNTVTEVFLVALSAEIGKRQNSDRADLFLSLLGNRGSRRSFLNRNNV